MRIYTEFINIFCSENEGFLYDMIYIQYLPQGFIRLQCIIFMCYSLNSPYVQPFISVCIHHICRACGTSSKHFRAHFAVHPFTSTHYPSENHFLHVLTRNLCPLNTASSYSNKILCPVATILRSLWPCCYKNASLLMASTCVVLISPYSL